MMERMLAVMEEANENTAKTKAKSNELLERQTKLQRESLGYEREFLDIFKSIANNMVRTR